MTSCQVMVHTRNERSVHDMPHDAEVDVVTFSLTSNVDPESTGQ